MNDRKELLHMNIINTRGRDQYFEFDNLFDIKNTKKIYKNIYKDSDSSNYNIKSDFTNDEIIISVINRKKGYYDIIFEFYKNEDLFQKIDIKMHHSRNIPNFVNGIIDPASVFIEKIKELNSPSILFEVLFRENQCMDNREYKIIEDLLLSLNNIAFDTYFTAKSIMAKSKLVYKSEKETKQLIMNYNLMKE